MNALKGLGDHPDFLPTLGILNPAVEGQSIEERYTGIDLVLAKCMSSNPQVACAGMDLLQLILTKDRDDSVQSPTVRSAIITGAPSCVSTDPMRIAQGHGKEGLQSPASAYLTRA